MIAGGVAERQRPLPSGWTDEGCAEVAISQTLDEADRLGPLIPGPSPTRGEGGSFGEHLSFPTTLSHAFLLPSWEKVAAKRSDEGAQRPGQEQASGA